MERQKRETKMSHLSRVKDGERQMAWGKTATLGKRLDIDKG